HIRFARFDSETDNGLRFDAIGDRLLHVAAKPLTTAELDEATHAHQLSPADTITVYVDYRQTGGAGVTSWGAHPLEPYRLLPGREYSYAFLISPPHVSAE